MNDKAMVYANVGVHAGVAIVLELCGDGAYGASIHFGIDGPDLCLEFADVDSLERLAVAAADGVRQLRERTTPTDRAAVPDSDADQLVRAGVGG